MKYPAEERERWLRQADHDLTLAQRLETSGDFADACYYAGQAAQKALKGYLYGRGERFIPEHSVSQLVERAAKFDQRFSALIGGAKTLDQYYVPTRYPDALAFPAVPFESYGAEQARNATAIAEEILGRVRGEG